MSLKLKVIPHASIRQVEASGTSASIHASPVPTEDSPRTFYLSDPQLVPPPLISCSPFVPPALVHHLMRNKKSSALGIKFVPGGRDSVTNMEGAMHSFVTPVVPRCEMVGDYVWRGRHALAYFGNSEKKRLCRSVVLSASIQPDFEDDQIMLTLSKLGTNVVEGYDLLIGDKWDLLSVDRKQDRRERAVYDAELRAHMIFHLTHAHFLPAKQDVSDLNILSTRATIDYLNQMIISKRVTGQHLEGKFLKLIGGEILSLELLFNIAVQQARNEFSALEALCPQGYVYTFDPASIFAATIGAAILNRLMLCALQMLSKHNKFANMRVYAFNDYTEPAIMPLVRIVLEEQQVRVMKKADLFMGKGGLYDVEEYEGCEGAMLVLHNNSDGFGQNIETEYMGCSLDGVIGASSSGAASLQRSREDLLDFVVM